MLIFDRLNNSRRLLLILDLLKIIFIIFIAFSFLVGIFPYYNGYDSADYGIGAKLLANGSWGFSNELLKETGLWEFVPWTWSKSVQNELVPLGNIGMFGLSTLAYLLGGHYGLFYIGPVFSILLIIAVDRISINLFGRFVAFVAVILVGTHWVIFNYGVQLYSDNIFTFFTIIGIFFLVKFFRNKKETLILLSTSFFVAAAFIRTSGIISFPIEIFLVMGFLFLPKILKSRINIQSKTALSSFYTYYKKNQKKIFRIIFFMSVPWMFFFLFNAAYNSYYFGDPLLNQNDVRPFSDLEWNLKSVLNNLSLDFFQWTEYQAIFLLPWKLITLLGIESIYEIDPYNHTWIGIISLLILFSGFLISFLTKDNRVEIVIFSLFIMGTVMFYSLAHISRIPNLEEYTPRSFVVTDPLSSIRYMVPAFPLFYMLFGFIMFKIWRINTEKISKLHFKTFIKILKFGFLVLVISFLVICITSFYDSFVFQKIKSGNFFNPQQELEKHYPIDLEGLPEKSVIVGFRHYRTVEYDAIHFFPYWGFNPTRINLEPDLIPQEPIQTLKQLLKGDEDEKITGSKSILNEGYSVFVLKQQVFFDTIYYNYLKSQHGIILKDYSPSFCKMELVNELNFSDPESKPDEICY